MVRPIKIKGILRVRFPNEPNEPDNKGLTSSNGSYFLGLSAEIQLISSTQADSRGRKGQLSNRAPVDGVIEKASPVYEEIYPFTFYLDYDKNFKRPGAFYIRNLLENEFFLISLTLEGVPKYGTIHFPCNSWIYNADKYQRDRIFFNNDTYLPSTTPALLADYRQLELETLRGDGKGERKRWERIYDYDVYNDLGDPDNNKPRPIAGGRPDRPYPRRGRTGRASTDKDVKCESRSTYVYIPRDEDLGNLEFSSFPDKLKTILKKAPPTKEFESFQDVYDLYEHIDYPKPHVIKENHYAWNSDEEFAREVIAGVNSGLICCLQEFPPKSKLNIEQYGDHTSKITEDDIKPYLDGSTVEKAIQDKKLFLLDHHDTIFPYLKKINSTSRNGYASRTIFFLKSDETLKPVAIELSLPHDDEDQLGPISSVQLPTFEAINSSNPLWPLAKAYVIVNDSCFHQIISHWLHTHAVIEPFSIATNRQLSVIHPIYKLLHPHYRNTMNINAAARQFLINADGFVEKTFLWGQLAVEMSSEIYKDWVFPDQALPEDLKKRGMAVPDENSPSGVKLVMKDYPYADDGLEIWNAIHTWVQEYVSIYYITDDVVRQDSELQSWWTEIVEKGHGDKKNEKWWPKMKIRKDLIDACTIIIWTASALHAAVNFGQYPYGGLILNRPTLSRRFMPKPKLHEDDYFEATMEPERAYLKTITSKPQALICLATLGILSKHIVDEQYLGQREDEHHWTSDTKALEAFKKFGKRLEGIQENINKKNDNELLKNRVGQVSMPYTLLYPSSEEGITFKGVPNSISI